MSEKISELMKTVLLDAAESLRYHAHMIEDSMLKEEKKHENFRDSTICKLLNNKIEEKVMHADIIESYVKNNFTKRD